MKRTEKHTKRCEKKPESVGDYGIHNLGSFHHTEHSVKPNVTQKWHSIDCERETGLVLSNSNSVRNHVKLTRIFTYRISCGRSTIQIAGNVIRNRKFC